ncbi:MAG: type II toxin-antitoxin system VapC family toxin [Alphaproteobacteria bacterium]|nr:type II toxin-antitoxin system VapC family toxin [Alphaproteobacteria bacterium]
MNLYLDASVLIPLFIDEARTGEAHGALAGRILIVSDFAMAEFSSGIARRARMGDISEIDAESVFATFDTWIARAAQRESLAAGDVHAALGLVRRLDLALRTPDAVNIAVAQRCGAALLTFDAKLAAAARSLGLDVLLAD